MVKELNGKQILEPTWSALLQLMLLLAAYACVIWRLKQLSPDLTVYGKAFEPHWRLLPG